MTLATIWRRMTAFLIDYIILLLYAGLLFATSPLLPAGWFATPDRSQLTAFLFLTLPVIVYFSVTEASIWQGTAGKKLRRVQVTAVNDGRIGLGRAFLRNGVKFLPWELAHTFVQHSSVWPEAITIPGSIGAMVLMLVFTGLIVVTPRRQAMWDIVARTIVIQARSNHH
jgi:uncharacterized RDD family membrane protein YckC